jgi:hypothetical protein
MPPGATRENWPGAKGREGTPNLNPNLNLNLLNPAESTMKNQEIKITIKIRIRKWEFGRAGKARHRPASLLKDSGARKFEKRNERPPNPVGLHRGSFGADAGIG